MGGPERLSHLWEVTQHLVAGPSHRCLGESLLSKERKERCPVPPTQVSLGLGTLPSLCPNPTSRPGMSSALKGRMGLPSGTAKVNIPLQSLILCCWLWGGGCVCGVAVKGGSVCQSEGGRRVGRGETQTSGPSAPRPPMGSRGHAGMEGHTLPPGPALEHLLGGGVRLEAVCLGPTRKWGISQEAISLLGNRPSCPNS